RFSLSCAPPARAKVGLYFSAPVEAPTTRGFAAILATGLDQQSAEDILAVPDDFYSDLGLAALISPLRLRGMSAMLAQLNRHRAIPAGGDHGVLSPTRPP